MIRISTLRMLVWTATIGYWLLLFTATHVPGEDLPTIPLGDKSAHLIGYGMLAVLVFTSLALARGGRPVFPVLVFGMAYGAVDEWLQAVPFIHRSCELMDWYADVTGTAIGIVLCMIVARWLVHRRILAT